MSDYWEDFEPVDVPLSENADQRVTIPLDRETVAQVQQAASRRGAEPIALLRLWILDYRTSQAGRAPIISLRERELRCH